MAYIEIFFVGISILGPDHAQVGVPHAGSGVIGATRSLRDFESFFGNEKPFAVFLILNMLSIAQNSREKGLHRRREEGRHRECPLPTEMEKIVVEK